MDDLIRRSDAISQSFSVTLSNGLEPYDLDVVAVGHINSIPAVDAVPIVRCKDCKAFITGQNESESWEWCKFWKRDCDGDLFCSQGKRREDGTGI